MISLRIAAAQSVSAAGDITANVLVHTKFMTAAHAEGVGILVFPELSLSGYELRLPSGSLLQPDDSRLAPIRALVLSTKMTVVVGAPIPNPDGAAFIGAITFFPDGRTAIYRKHFLHAGEERFVAAGAEKSQHHHVGDAAFALAICADTTHGEHARNAAATGASLYLTGVLVSDAGYPADAGQLRGYARSYRMGVLMANHGGPSGGYISAGKSAFWAPGGELVAAAPGPGNCLVIATNDGAGWNGQICEVAV